MATAAGRVCAVKAGGKRRAGLAWGGRWAAQGKEGRAVRLGFKASNIFSHEVKFKFERNSKCSRAQQEQKYAHKTPTITKALKNIFERFLFLKVFEFELICAK